MISQLILFSLLFQMSARKSVSRTPRSTSGSISESNVAAPAPPLSEFDHHESSGTASFVLEDVVLGDKRKNHDRGMLIAINLPGRKELGPLFPKCLIHGMVG